MPKQQQDFAVTQVLINKPVFLGAGVGSSFILLLQPFWWFFLPGKFLMGVIYIALKGIVLDLLYLPNNIKGSV